MYFIKELSMSEPVTYRNKETNQKKIILKLTYFM